MASAPDDPANDIPDDPPPPQTVTVTFNSNGGNESLQTVQVTVGSTVGSSMPTVTRNGFTFLEWNVDPNGNGLTFTSATEVTQNIEVYAIWQQDEIDPGDPLDPLDPGDELDPGDPDPDPDPEEPEEPEEPDPEEPEIFTVTFDANGGIPTIQTESVVGGNTVAVFPNVIKEGFTFVEWNTSDDGEGAVFTTSTTITENITVYAIWEENEVEPDPEPEPDPEEPIITISENTYVPSDLNLEHFEDGLYTFTIKIIIGEEEVEHTYQLFLTCKIRLCIDEMLTSVDIEKDCGCKNNQTKIAFYLDDMYTTLESSILIGDFERATCILKTLQKLCKPECGNCK